MAYGKQFVRKLGLDPPSGTLNIKLSSNEDFELRRELS